MKTSLSIFKNILRLHFFVIIFVTPAFSQNQPVKPEIKIGIILPLTGALSHVGAAFRDAGKLALEDAKPSKFTYKLIFEDDGLEPKKVASAAQRIINFEKVNAIVSTWSYGGSVVAPLAERNKIPHFGVAWDATIAKGDYNFIHLTPPEEFTAKVIAVFSKKHYKKIASFGVQESGSVAALEEMKKQALLNNMEVVSESVPTMEEKDFRSYLLKMKTKNPDVIYANIVANVEIFKRQLNELQISTPLVVMTGLDVANDLSLFEDSWYVSDTFVPADFHKRFQEKFQHKQTYGIGNYYDIVKLLVWLFEMGEGTEIPAGKEIIERTKRISEFKSIFDNLSISEAGIIRYPARYFVVKEQRRVRVEEIQ